jgi:hypothetical protein
MRIAAAVLFSLSACASGAGDGAIVDASQVGAPFSWVGGGFTSQSRHIGSTASTEEMTFLFENVSGRPQTAESLTMRQRNQSASPLLIDATSVRIGRMIEPGEELEVKMLVRVTPVQAERGAPMGFRRGLELDIMLRHSDGTTYRFPIEMPMPTTVTLRP